MERKCPYETAHVQIDINTHIGAGSGTFSIDAAQIRQDV